MKKIVFKVVGLLLVASCLFGVVCVGGNLSDILKCKDSWEKLGKESEENLTLLGEGIDKLSENTEAYRSGAELYTTSLKQYEDGVAALEAAKQQLAEGKETYNAGKNKYNSSKSAYNAKVKAVNEAKVALAEGEQTLKDNEQAYLDGKQTLADNKQAYEDGKAKLEEVETIYNIAKTVSDVTGSVPIVSGINNIEIADYSINGIISEYEAGQAQIQQYEDGQAKVAEYEAGVQKLAESKKTLAEYDVKLADADSQLAAGAAKLSSAAKQIESGELQIADGEAQLADGKAQLDDAKIKLGQYEDGEGQLAAGLDKAMNQDTYYDDAGRGAITSIKNRLGSGFTFYETDAAGNVVAVNGVDFVSIDKAREVLDAGWGFFDDTQAGVTAEITGRIISVFLVAVACLLGIFAGVGAFTQHRVLTAVTATLAAIAAIAGYLYISVVSSNYYVFSKNVGSLGHGNLAAAVGIIALVALVASAIGFLSGEKKAAPAVAAE